MTNLLNRSHRSCQVEDFTTIIYPMCFIRPSVAADDPSLNSTTLKKLEVHKEVYKKGLEKFNKELDLVNVIKSLRQLKVVVKMILDDHQQTLSMFHNDTLIRIEPIRGIQIGKQIQSARRTDIFSQFQSQIMNSKLDSLPKQG